MSIERPERPARAPLSPYGRFGSTMHIGMGIVIMVLAGFVIYSGHNDPNFKLSPKESIIVGGFMLLYGGFRLFRGIMQMRRRGN